MNEAITDAVVVLNNIKRHEYVVGDYKLPPKEAEIVKTALEEHIKGLKFDEVFKEPIA